MVGKMWIVAKLKNREYSIFYQSLKKNFQENIEIYTPKISVKVKRSNKCTTKSILNNYAFMYHSKFSDKKFVNNLQNLPREICKITQIIRLLQRVIHPAEV